MARRSVGTVSRVRSSSAKPRKRNGDRSGGRGGTGLVWETRDVAVPRTYVKRDKNARRTKARERDERSKRFYDTGRRRRDITRRRFPRIGKASSLYPSLPLPRFSILTSYARARPLLSLSLRVRERLLIVFRLSVARAFVLNALSSAPSCAAWRSDSFLVARSAPFPHTRGTDFPGDFLADSRALCRGASTRPFSREKRGAR